jgi:hypothetical protein
MGLEQSIADLYRVFERYPRPEQVYGSPISVSAEDIARLSGAGPLQSMSGAELSNYAFKALRTWGTLEDFKHYLPRLLELLSLGSDWLLYPELLLANLTSAKWFEWPLDEHEVIAQYLLALWQSAVLGKYLGCMRVSEFLKGLGSDVVELEPFLSYWKQQLACNDLAALRHLADFVYLSAAPLNKGKKLERFHQTLVWQVVDTLKEVDLTGKLEQAFFDYGADAELARDFSRAVDYLWWL